MNAEKLKSSILQYAMQGKIVEQNQEDEPIEELFQKIQLEKKQLRKNGTMKPEVALAPITDEEIPFEIPQTWKWERLGNLSSKIHYGYTASAQEKGNAKLLRITDIQNNHVNWETVPFCTIEESKLEALALKDRDILIARTGGTIGKSFLISSVEDISVFASYLIRVQPLTNIFEEYLIYYLQSELYWGQLRRMSAGTGQPNVNAQNLKKLILPIPPIEEQKRIVDKIKILEEQVVIYGNVYNQNEANRAKFPFDLEKSILQYAMQGKLVPQYSSDESADILIGKIKKEKEELVRQKIIKKENEIPPISDKEIPHMIPDTWKWVRLRELGFIISGGTPKTAISDYWDEGGLLWITPSDMGKFKEKYIASSSRKISQEGLKSSSAQLIPGNSIVYSSRAPIGHINIVEESYSTNQGCKSIHPLKEYTSLEFLYYALKFMTPWIQKKASGTTFKEVSGTTFGESIIPIPPVEEQKRIVDKIEELHRVTKMLHI